MYQDGYDVTSPLPDYLEVYMREGGFDLNGLLRDDFFDAIRMVWNAKKYISALKLLFCMVDSLAYIEFGDDRESFLTMAGYFLRSQKPLRVSSQELLGVERTPLSI